MSDSIRGKVVITGASSGLGTDVKDRERAGTLVDTAVKAHRRLDGVVNNTGLMPQSLLERPKLDGWDQRIDVNLKGGLCVGSPRTVNGPRAVDEVAPLGSEETE